MTFTQAYPYLMNLFLFGVCIFLLRVNRQLLTLIKNAHQMQRDALDMILQNRKEQRAEITALRSLIQELVDGRHE